MNFFRSIPLHYWHWAPLSLHMRAAWDNCMGVFCDYPIFANIVQCAVNATEYSGQVSSVKKQPYENVGLCDHWTVTLHRSALPSAWSGTRRPLESSSCCLQARSPNPTRVWTGGYPGIARRESTKFLYIWYWSWKQIHVDVCAFALYVSNVSYYQSRYYQPNSRDPAVGSGAPIRSIENKSAKGAGVYLTLAEVTG